MKENWPKENVEYPIPEGLDLENVWGQIEDKRNKNKKKRRFLWIFFSSMLCGVLLLSWIYMSHVEVVPVDVEYDVAYNTMSDSNASMESIDMKPDANNIVDQNNLNSKRSIVGIEPLSLDERNANDSKIIDLNQIALDLAKSESITTKSNASKTKSNTKVNNVTQTSAVVSSRVIVEENMTRIIEVVSDLSVEDAKDSRELYNVGRIEGLIISLKVPMRKMRKRRQHKIELAFRKEMFLGSRFMVGYTGRNFESLSGPVDNKHFDVRNVSETVLESYGTELYLRGVVTSSIFYEVGLSMSNVVLKSDHRYQVQSSSLVQDDSALEIEYLDGSIGHSSGVITDYITDTYESTKYSQLLAVGIPMRIGYYKSLSQKIDLGVSTGVVYNFTSKSKGSIVAKDDRYDVFADISKEGYDNKQFLQSTTQLTLSYDLNYKWSIEGGVHYLHDINSRLNQSNASDKYKSVNAQIGVVFRL